MHAVNPWMIAPFVLLLGAIAVLPLRAHAWWERHYPKVALSLGAVSLFYYLGVLRVVERPMFTVHEYVSFICLIGSLFVVSGGIHIQVKGESKPWSNVAMLGVGALLANVIGTTGASMILIRPFLRANRYRLTSYHVVFFIFIVSNVGGALTPIGDPPLYLGYLKGIPFIWTLHALWQKWLFGVVWLLLAFFIVDYRNYLRTPPEVREKETTAETCRFEGLLNLVWLLVILGSLFVHRPVFVREALMVFAAVMSWKTTRSEVYQSNEFSWAPIREVAILFAGIFMTMMPALDWLEANTRTLGVVSAGSFYWGSGCLSSVLDNAPTYLNFLSASIGLFVDQTIVEGVQQLVVNGGALTITGPASEHAREIVNTVLSLRQYHPEALQAGALSLNDIQIAYLLGNHREYIIAVSIGSVFFGACTYIGNGPNFMVKSISEHAGARTPTFLGYIFKFTLPFLLPMLAAVWWLFFR